MLETKVKYQVLIQVQYGITWQVKGDYEIMLPTNDNEQCIDVDSNLYYFYNPANNISKLKLIIRKHLKRHPKLIETVGWDKIYLTAINMGTKEYWHYTIDELVKE